MKRVSKSNKRERHTQGLPKEKLNITKRNIKSNTSENSSFLLKLIETKPILCLTSLIIVIGFFAFKDFLLVKYIYFFKDIGSDTLNNIFPSVFLSQKLKANALYSTWSFNIGMGQAYFSGIPIFVNPLYYFNLIIQVINEALWDENSFVYAKFWGIFINHFLMSGILFYFYLRSIKIEKFVSIIGALLVAFLGYSVLGSSWGHSGIVFSSIFFLLATEQLLSRNRWYFFPLAVTYIAGNPFYLYVNSLFIAIYLVFRFFFFENSKLKDYLLNIGKMFVLGFWGISLSLVNNVNSYFTIFNSPRVNGGVGYFDKLSSKPVFSLDTEHYGENVGQHLTAMYRLFSNDILGNGSNFKGWYNYLEAPVFYVGLLTLLLIPQLFIFIDKKKKIAVASFLSFWALIVIFPFFRYAFNAFTGDYYKIGLDVFIPLSLLLLAVLSFNFIYNEAKIHLTTLGVSLLILLVALYLPDLGDKHSVVVSLVRNWVTIFLIIYAILLYALGTAKYRNLALVGVLALVFVELSSFSYYTANEREAYSAREFKQSAGGYFDNTMDAVVYLNGIDSTFYRAEKNYSSGTSKHGSLNDAKVQGYYGTTSYSSFNQGNYVRFLQEVGVIEQGNETQTRWVTGLRGQPILSTWGNIKYFFTKSDSSNFLNLGYSVIQKTGDVNILKNHYYLPMGYTYSSYMSLGEFRQLTRFQKDMALLNTVIVEDKTKNQLAKYLPERFKTDSLIAITETIFGQSFVRFHTNDFDTSLTDTKKSLYAQFRNKLMADTLTITAHGQNFIEGKISLQEPKLLFFTIPFDFGWEAIVNGKKQTLIKTNIGFTGLMLEAGKYEIKLKYLPPYFKLSLWITIIAEILFAALVIIGLIQNRKYKA